MHAALLCWVQPVMLIPPLREAPSLPRTVVLLSRAVSWIGCVTLQGPDTWITAACPVRRAARMAVNAVLNADESTVQLAWWASSAADVMDKDRCTKLTSSLLAIRGKFTSE